MSGKSASFAAMLSAAIAIATFGLLAKPAHASNWTDTVMAPLLTPLADPLLTRPRVLDAGAVLPGDAAPLLCPPEGPENAVGVIGVLTLTQAVDLALCRNPLLQGTWAAIKVQAEAVGEARAAYLPTATMTASHLRDRTHFSGSGQDGGQDSTSTTNSLLNDQYSASVVWRLFDFGGRDANRRAADAQLEAALSNHDANLQKTLTGVIGAYFDAQTAWATWQTKQTNEELAQHTLQTTQRRESRGANARSDSLQATTALAKASLDKARAQGAYQRAVSVLVYALGAPPGTSVTLPQEDLAGTDSGAPTSTAGQELEAWLAQVDVLHPAIAAARAQLAAAREKVVSTRSEGLPTLDLTANFYRNGRPNQGLSSVSSRETLVGLTLNIPLFEGFARVYKVGGAQAQAEQQEATLVDTEHQVLMEVVKAHADAMASLANLDASKKLLVAAQAAMSSVQHKFDKGAADLLEILSTQTALSDAQQERIRCVAEWRSARLRLMATSGILSRQSLLENALPSALVGSRVGQ